MTTVPHNCIFSSYCTKSYCDLSCPKNAIMQLLLEKSGIEAASVLSKLTPKIAIQCHELLNIASGNLITIETKTFDCSTIEAAEILCFVGMCDMCEKHGSSISVYNLKYGKYVQMLKDSWTHGSNQSLQEMQAFISTSKYLIISGLDYIIFKDFECQTLLNLLQDRDKINNGTFVILPEIQQLHGSSVFFPPLKDKFKEGLIK